MYGIYTYIQHYMNVLILYSMIIIPVLVTSKVGCPLAGMLDRFFLPVYLLPPPGIITSSSFP